MAEKKKKQQQHKYAAQLQFEALGRVAAAVPLPGGGRRQLAACFTFACVPTVVN